MGVGILGKEGNQAASFSDYSIAEFRSLRKLILWHGRQFGISSGDFVCTCLFKNVALSISLTAYNVYAGFSGFQMIDSIFWLSYNLITTCWMMGWKFVFDQDVPMVHSANLVSSNALLVGTREPSSPEKSIVRKSTMAMRAASLDAYEEETRKCGLNLADYYAFCKRYYQLPLIMRTLLWEMLGIVSGIVSYYLAFGAYGFGVANESGRTEDMFTIALAVYQSNILIHHLQLFTTVRNWTPFLAVNAVLSLSIMWPWMCVLAQRSPASEYLRYHVWTALFQQFFLQSSIVVLSTFIVTSIIYLAKIVKMQYAFPAYFPTTSSLARA